MSTNVRYFVPTIALTLALACCASTNSANAPNDTVSRPSGSSTEVTSTSPVQESSTTPPTTMASNSIAAGQTGGSASLLRHKIDVNQGQPTALLHGTIVEHDGCLWGKSELGEYLLLWSHDYERSSADPAVITGYDRTFKLGEVVALPGGTTTLATVADKASIPEACQRDTIWIVGR